VGLLGGLIQCFTGSASLDRPLPELPGHRLSGCRSLQVLRDRRRGQPLSIRDMDANVRIFSHTQGQGKSHLTGLGSRPPHSIHIAFAGASSQ